MKKVYLFALLMLLIGSALFANAQSGTGPSIEQTHLPQFSVNLSVLGTANRSVADEYLEEADRFERFGDFDAAINMLSKAAKEYQANKKYNRYGSTLIRLSNVHLLLSNYGEAEQIVLKQVLKNYTKIGSKTGQMSTYQQLGKIYLAANKLPQSLWFYTQHGILAQQLRDSNAYIESVLGIASVKIKKKDYQLAVKDLNNAELLAKTANTVQYNQLIKSNRALIAERTTVKKG